MNSKVVVRLLALTVALQAIIPAASISAPDAWTWAKGSKNSQPVTRGYGANAADSKYSKPQSQTSPFTIQRQAAQKTEPASLRDSVPASRSKIEYTYKPPTPQLRDNGQQLNEFGTYRKPLPERGPQSVLPGRFDRNEATDTSDANDDGPRVIRKPDSRPTTVRKPEEDHVRQKPQFPTAQGMIEGARRHEEEREQREKDEAAAALGRLMDRYMDAGRRAREAGGTVHKPAKEVTNPRVTTEACPEDQPRIIEKPRKEVRPQVTVDVRRDNDQRVIEKPAKEVTNPKVTTDECPEDQPRIIEKPRKEVRPQVTVDVRRDNDQRVIEKPAKEVTNPKVTTDECPGSEPRVIEKPRKEVRPQVTVDVRLENDQRVIEKPRKEVSPQVTVEACPEDQPRIIEKPGKVATNPKTTEYCDDRVSTNTNVPQPQWTGGAPQAEVTHQCVCPHCGNPLGIVVVRAK